MARDESIDVDVRGFMTLADQIAFEKATTPGQRRSITRQALRPVRRAVQQGYRRSVRENRRHAELAVKAIAWKNSYGGSVAINSMGRRAVYKLKDDPKKAKNRRTRPTQRTIEMRSYYGRSASYLLRWVNAGTGPRRTKGERQRPLGARKRKLVMSGQATGSMPARPFFEPAAKSQRDTAMRISMALIRKHIELAAERNK
jgi:hypothetical protein